MVKEKWIIMLCFLILQPPFATPAIVQCFGETPQVMKGVSKITAFEAIFTYHHYLIGGTLQNGYAFIAYYNHHGRPDWAH